MLEAAAPAGGPPVPNGPEFLQSAYWGRAVVLGKLGRHAKALGDWDRAMDRRLPRPGGEMLTERAVALARGGRPADALAAADGLAGKDKKVPAAVLVELARACALAAAHAGGDETLAGKAADRAVGLIERAKAAGYFRNPAAAGRLKADPDFAAVRGRIDAAVTADTSGDK